MNDTQKIEEIRELLRNFDPDDGDRQYAMEQIEQIVEAE